MQKKWNIHSDNMELKGPWSATQIRDLLRQGAIDPFAVVSPSSNPDDRSELIEIDEIFALGSSNEEKTSPSQTIDRAASHPKAVSEKAFAEPLAAENQQKTKLQTLAPPPAQVSGPGSFLGLADPKSEVVQDPSEGDRKKQRKYFLIDEHGSKSDIMTAQDVLDLHLAKRINSRYKVGKVGATGAVSIGRFIRTYSKTSSSPELPEVPRLLGDKRPSENPRRNNSPSSHSERGSSLKKPTSNRLLVPMLLALLGLSSAGLYFSLKDQGTSVEPDNQAAREDFRSSKLSKAESKPKKGGKKPPSINLLDRANLRRSNQRSARKFKQLPTKTPSPQANRPRGPIISRVSDLAKANNRLVNVGPLSFKRSELDACPLKCNLNMRDRANRLVSVSFFKGAFQDELKGKDRTVFIKGTVKGKGAHLYLSKVY